MLELKDLSHKIRSKLVKDFNLDINVVQSPYFEYFLDLYNDYNGAKEKSELLLETVRTLGSEEEFFKYLDKLQNNIVTSIKEQPEYHIYNTCNFEFKKPNLNIKQTDIYNIENHNKYYLSIDLQKANYYALRYFNSHLVFHTDSFEEFMTNVTSFKYFIESKQIRQVIFGQLNPGRQKIIQQFLIYELLEVLLNYFEKDKIKSISHDEIVIELKNFDEYLIRSYIPADLYSCTEKLGIKIHLKLFQLKSLKTEKKNFFVKEYINNKVEFKCVESLFLPQVFKHYYKQELNENDLTFYHERQLATFKNPLQFIE